MTRAATRDFRSSMREKIIFEYTLRRRKFARGFRAVHVWRVESWLGGGNGWSFNG